MEKEIIMVDDDDISIMINKEILNECGFSEAKIFTDAEEVLPYMESRREGRSFLVLLDINLPVYDGWDFLDELENKSIKDAVKVIIVSSSINERDKVKARTYDKVLDYIEKPLRDVDCKIIESNLNKL